LHNLTSHIYHRALRAGLALFAVTATAFAPKAAWAQSYDAPLPSAPPWHVVASQPVADLAATQIDSPDPVGEAACCLTL
jgi:hypothetical protein